MPCATSTSDAARFSVRIWSIGALEVGLGRLALAMPADEHPVPRRFVRISTSPGRAPPLRSSRSGCAGTDHRQPVFRLRVADRVAAGQRSARLADLRRGALEDGRERVPRQVLGERRDRQREQDAATHREHVAQRVRGRDLAERPRVIDERREEVERADDREVVRDPVRGARRRAASGRRSSSSGGSAAASAPRPASASARRSAPSFAAHPPQSVSSVRRIGGRVSRAAHRSMIGGAAGCGRISGRGRRLRRRRLVGPDVVRQHAPGDDERAGGQERRPWRRPHRSRRLSMIRPRDQRPDDAAEIRARCR